MRNIDLHNFIANWKDFPKEGILFRDLNPALRNPISFSYISDKTVDLLQGVEIDVIAGIEARGFVIGTMLALKLNKGLVMIRKAGKLPGPVISESCTIEYGKATVEIQNEAISKGQKILIADDLIATGGTALAATKLVEQLGGQVSALIFVINLKNLNGTTLLEEQGYKVYSVVDYE